MLENKKRLGRRRAHSPSCVSKMTGSQFTGIIDPVPAENPDHGIVYSDISPEIHSAGRRKVGFPDRVYQLASLIFQNSVLENLPAEPVVKYGQRSRVPVPEVKNDEVQRQAYELFFNTLKYKELLENIMIDGRSSLSETMPEDQMSLVAVVLFDLQDRKFHSQSRQAKDDVIQEVRDVENHLLSIKTKLAASLARCRIKHNLLSIDLILPKSVRMKQERARRLPLYAWVNALRSSSAEVQDVLKAAGFSQVNSIGQLEGKTFCQDLHCDDLLVLPAQMKTHLVSTRLLSSHKLLLQDKTCSVGPHAVSSLLPEGGDVLMVGSFSGLTVSHTASLVSQRYDNGGSPTVYACVNNLTNAQRRELQQAVTATGCKNVQLISEDFQTLQHWDKRLLGVRVVLLTPRCSLSAISNLVDFILSENEDIDLLLDLSRGSVSQSKLEALVVQQRGDMDHALTFPKVVAVVFSTCSSYPEENEAVVSRALQEVKIKSVQDRKSKKTINFRPIPSPLGCIDFAQSPFFTLEPSEESNGCFLAVLKRESDPVIPETPHQILLRAYARGILSDKNCNHLQTTKDPKMTKRAQPGSVRTQEIKGSNPIPLCGHQGFSNQWRLAQVKSRYLMPPKRSSSYSAPSSTSRQEDISHPPPKTVIPTVINLPISRPHLLPSAPPPPRRPWSRVPHTSRSHHRNTVKPAVVTLPAANFLSLRPGQKGLGASINTNRTPGQSQPNVTKSADFKSHLLL